MSADLCRQGSCIARADDPSERSDYDAFVTCRMSSPTVFVSLDDYHDVEN
ncbi:hypothetical protein B0H14DRAFT_3490055 [Mycena olivaceomarginata]|nr:hypothetical protein B0H14DRAFT_3490055 [Mycena olivaceomarginata]